MTPVLKPLLGIPGICSLALIANLQNTDAATREAFFRTMEVIGKNLDEILKENG